MAEPFLAETRIMSFGFAPQGWALCNGQLLPVRQNQALFALLGVNFGGDGIETFGLPDLRGRTPIHFDNNHTIGQKGGEEAHVLTNPEMPTHTHSLKAKTTLVNNNIPDPANYLGQTLPNLVYSSQSQNFNTMNAASLSFIGGNQPHTNMQPYLTLNFCIALRGIFPTQN